jgi:hypothetical protein
MLKKFRREQTPGGGISWVFSTTDVMPAVRRNEIHNIGDAIGDESLEPSRVSTEPSKDNGAISPSKHFVGRNIKQSSNMVQEIGKKICSAQLQTWNGQALDGSNLGL